jgi:hypothetical protein
VAGWWVLLAVGVALYSTPGLLQLRASRGEHVPGLGWRVDVGRLPMWTWLPFFAGISLVITSTNRLTALTWPGVALAVGCFAVSWLAQLALVRAHNRRLADRPGPVGAAAGDHDGVPGGRPAT